MSEPVPAQPQNQPPPKRPNLENLLRVFPQIRRAFLRSTASSRRNGKPGVRPVRQNTSPSIPEEVAEREWKGLRILLKEAVDDLIMNATRAGLDPSPAIRFKTTWHPDLVVRVLVLAEHVRVKLQVLTPPAAKTVQPVAHMSNAEESQEHQVTGVPSEGEWSRPMSLIEMGVRLGNITRRAVRKTLNPYGLRRFNNNRQLYVVRFDGMPLTYRRRLDK